ncbi:MAG TPA: maltose alpha-D-glucosyltransferase, partial [Chloroflexota bacterium]
MQSPGGPSLRSGRQPRSSRPRSDDSGSVFERDALWYKDAIIYEVPVRAFFDSDGDGIGDFAGLVQKLDYIQELGVTAIWLLPFYPSPLRDDGYDIANYRAIHPSYGALRDFRHFIREAHRRGLAVITELIINHTSDQHPWFQRARKAPPNSRWRQFYVWTDKPDRYAEARIIFKDFESSNWTWDPVARSYYWHRFYSHQPDLNFDSPDVRRAVLRVMDFWLKMGVDGMRLDAVPYLYERDGTSCENLPETHEFLKHLRSYVDEHYPNRMLLAEANQWPDDAAAYFGNGEECHMAFHFPVMPRLFMALRTEDCFPVVDIFKQTPAIPERCQWALFLRNHDELTLEMVTDEDRDYMYRVYARDMEARINLGIRRRLAPLLGNHDRRIELMNALLCSLPGTPVLYYGDEIGMGDNVYLGDRNGVRTPMQWSPDRNAGFSRANPQSLYLPIIVDPEYHYEAVNVAAQHSNPSSMLWWMRRLIALRKRYQAFGRGTMEMLAPENSKILAFLRILGEERILVVANLSRFAQVVHLDLATWAGMVPIELFSHSNFPTIGTDPYLLTMAPHTFFWFALAPERVEAAPFPPTSQLPVLAGSGNWMELLGGRQKRIVELALTTYVAERRWFRGKARAVRGVTIRDVVPLGGLNGALNACLLILGVDYREGESDTYVLPMTVARGGEARRVGAESPQAIVARLGPGGADDEAVLMDALWDEAFCNRLLQTILRRRHLRGQTGELVASARPVTNGLVAGRDGTLTPLVGKEEQSNSSVTFGGRLMLKLFRRLDEGVNPEVEVGQFLTERERFGRAPAVLGRLDYHAPLRESSTVAVVTEFVPNQGDAWRYTLDDLALFFERALTWETGVPPVLPEGRLVDLAQHEIPTEACTPVGLYLESARLLGQRTAELHLALSGDPKDSAFSPEPFTPFYQRSLHQSLRRQAIQSLHLLKRRANSLPEGLQPKVQEVLAAEEAIIG